jgi:hypothetical protein
MLQKPKVAAALQMGYVAAITRQKIVHAQHLVPSRQQGLAQMRTDKPGTSGNNRLHA